MEQIAPLAKILAEANGIDWQQLRGTGAGGTVVEQDILNYLSRIMSGEEEPPSTPVDETPAGWTGDEQLPAGMFSADMLSQAGIDSDIADFVTQSRAPEMPAAAPEPQHDSMEFELDDDTADLDAPLAAEPAPQPAASDWPWNPANGQAAHATPPAPFPSLDAPEVHDLPAASPVPEVVPMPPAPAPSAPAASGLGSLLSRLYSKDKAEPEAPAAAPHHAVAQPAPVNEAAPEVHVPDIAAPEIAAPEIAAPALDDHMSPAATAELAAPELAAPEFAAPHFEAPEAAEEVAPAAVAEPAATQPAAAPQAQPAEVAAPDVQPLAASAAPQAAMPAEAVWFGTYLRREAQISAAHDLSAQLSEALGHGVSVAFLVARAAQRHADILGLDLGQVALLGADGQEQPITGAALRDAVNVPAQQAGSPDLLVTDAGALGVDDLHFPQTLTLSLGRIQEGRVALSLNGNVEPRQGAQFLSRVAEALEKPIALVL